jgi:hypothetical protein
VGPQPSYPFTGVKSRAPLTSPPSLVVRQSLQVRSRGAAGQRRGGGREQVWAAAARMRRAVGDDNWQSTRCGTGAAAGSRGLSTDHREAPPEELLCERRSSGRALPLVPQPLSGAASSRRPSRAARRELPPPAPHTRSGLRGKACQRLAGAAWSRTKLVFCDSVWAKLLQRARFKGLRPRSRPRNARLGGLQLKLVLEPWEKPSQRGLMPCPPSGGGQSVVGGCGHGKRPCRRPPTNPTLPRIFGRAPTTDGKSAGGGVEEAGFGGV